VSGGNEEVIGGLSDALVGLKKGDKCLVGIPPKLFYRGSQSGPIDLASRAYPGSWLLLEVEVCKVKSGDSGGKKKDKAPAAKNTVPFEDAAAAVATVPMSAPTGSASPGLGPGSGSGGVGGTGARGDDDRDRDAIAARMARIAGGAGGNANAQMAGIIGGGGGGHGVSPSQTHHKQHQQHQQQQQQQNVSSYNQQGQNNQSNQQYNDRFSHNDDHYNNGNNQPENVHQYDQSQRAPHQRSSDSRNANYNGNGRQSWEEPHRSNHQQQQQQQYQNQNQLTVIEGQTARGYYGAEENEDGSGYQGHNNRSSGFNDGSHNVPGQNIHGNIHGRQQMQQPFRANAGIDGAVPLLQQSVSAVQQSMLQLHTKMDQMSSQLTASSMSLQHTLPGVLPTSANSSYMLSLQQQQMAAMGLMLPPQHPQFLGAQGNPSSAATSGGSSALRIKTEDLVSSLQALLAEVEREKAAAASEGAQKGNSAELSRKEAETAEARETSRQLKLSVGKLEEKNESLQV
jgi:hypothetical protein